MSAHPVRTLRAKKRGATKEKMETHVALTASNHFRRGASVPKRVHLLTLAMTMSMSAHPVRTLRAKKRGATKGKRETHVALTASNHFRRGASVSKRHMNITKFAVITGTAPSLTALLLTQMEFQQISGATSANA